MAGFPKLSAVFAIQAVRCLANLHLICPVTRMEIVYPLLKRRIFIMNQRAVQSWQDKEALKRFQMISPLLDETLDQAKSKRTIIRTYDKNHS